MALKSPRRGVQSIRRHHSAALGSFPSRSFYVDATLGNDANSGTYPDEAWQTIGKVNGETFLPGDRIRFIRDGEWREQLTPPSSGIAGKPITFSTYGSGAAPIINGADIVTGWAAYGAGAGSTWQSALAVECNQVFMDEVKLTEGVVDRDNLNDHEWIWVGNVLYVRDDTGDPDGSVVIEASQRDHCIDAGTEDYVTFQHLHLKYGNARNFDTGNGATNLALDTLLVDYSTEDCIRFTGANTHSNTAKNCEASYSGGGGGIIVMTSSYSNTITDNNCHHNAEDGVAVGGDAASGEAFVGGINNIIRGNSCHDNLEDGIDLKQGPQIVEDNDCYDNAEQGIIIHRFAEEVIVRYNRFRDNTVSGIRIAGPNTNPGETVDNHQIYYNLVYGNGDYGFLAGGGAHVLIEMVVRNNVFYHNSGQFGDFRYIGDELTLQNNIFVSNDAAYCARIQTWASMTIDNNCYDNNTGGSVGNVFRDADAPATYTETDVNDGTLFAALGFEDNGIGTDPVMTNPGADDFTLQAGSPCRDAGVDVGLTRDYADVPVPQETSPAMGAYEFVP